MPKEKTKERKPRAKREKAPKPKHVMLETEQRLHIHVTKGAKEISEYIAGADAEGVVRMNPAPEAAAPVSTPDPVSGT